MDENKSRVFGLFDRTAVGVVEDNIISNRQRGHCHGAAVKVALSMRQCLNIPPHDSIGELKITAQCSALRLRLTAASPLYRCMQYIYSNLCLK